MKKESILKFIEKEIKFIQYHLDCSKHEIPKGKTHLQGRLWELEYLKESIENKLS